MRKFLLITGLVFLSSAQAFAANFATVNVNGMVCDFCARAIEKVFSKQESVETMKVDLTAKTITLFFKDGQNMEDEKIKSLVNDSGYAVTLITRGEEKGKKDGK